MFESKFLRRILLSLYKRFWLVLLAAVVFFGFSLSFTSRTAPTSYSAKVTLLSTANLAYSEIAQGRQAFRDYRDVISSRKIADKAAAALASEYTISAEQIQRMIKTVYNIDSAILTIEAVSFNELEVVPVANSVARAFISELQNATTLSGFRVLDEATRPVRNASDASSRMMMRVLTALIGALFAMGVIMLMEIFNTKVRGMADLSSVEDVEIIGVIPTHRI